MPRIQLTYGNSALAWGRDQARSARVLASESPRAPSVSSRQTPEPQTTSRVATPPTSSSSNRFARLLADISNASIEMSESEMSAQGIAPEIASATAKQTGATQTSVGMHAAAERARQAGLPNQMSTPKSVAALAQEILATQREGDAIERRERIEDRVKKIALTAKREPVNGSPQLSLAYDQIGFGVGPRAQVDRTV